MTNDPADRRQQREEDWNDLLLALYRRSGGDPYQHTFGSHLAEDLDWPDEKVYSVAHELTERGAVEVVSTGPMYVLTPPGADAVEEAVLEGDLGELTDQVNAHQADRARVLRRVYEASGANTMESVSIADMEEPLELERQRLHGIVKWLADRYLLKHWTMGSVVITQEGIDSIEVAREKPDEPAISGLSAFNSIEVSNSPGATVMAVQGSPGASVTFNVQRDEQRLDDLLELLDRIRDELDLDDAGQAALEAVQGQADLGRSDSPIIHGGLAEVRAFAAGVGASTIGSLIINYLAGAPPF